MHRQVKNCRVKSRPFDTPENEENTEELLKRAKKLINAEYRDALYIKKGTKGRVAHLKTRDLTPASSIKHIETASVKAARLKIQSEWEALKNGSLMSDGKSPLNDANEQTSDKGATALRGIVAYIEMKNRSKLPAMKTILENMGATVSHTFSKEVTHVIYKQGSLTTVQQAIFLNVHLVSVLWIEACKNSKTKVLEKLFPVVDFNDYTESPRVFRRFMEMGQKDREKLITKMLKKSQDRQNITICPKRVTRSSSKSAENSRLEETLTDNSTKKTATRKSERIILETQDSQENVRSQLQDLSNPREPSKESNNSSIRLHISTDDSSNKISLDRKKTVRDEKENVNSDSDHSFSILTKRKPAQNLKVIENVGGRRIFASARDSCIDENSKCLTKKKNPVLKRKLFDPIDTSFTRETSDSDFGSRGSYPKVIVINPYKSNKEINKNNKKNTKESKQKSNCNHEIFNSQIKKLTSNARGVEKKTEKTKDKQVMESSTQQKDKPTQVEDKTTQVKDKTTQFKQKRTLGKKKIIQVETKPSKVKIKSNQIKIKTKQLLNTAKKRRLAERNEEFPSIVSTSLHTQENKFLRTAIDTLGGFVFKPCVVRDTTHVIAGEPRRTLNILKAISRGCWVLRKQWVINSMAAGRWLPQENYEMTEFSKIVQKSRIEKQTFGDDYQLDIFTECGAIYISPRSEPSDKDLKELVLLCGGKIVSLARKADIVVGENLLHHNICVSYIWILDSVEYGRCKSLKKYALVGT